MCKILAVGLENDPWLELPFPHTSVFRDGHTHFSAPLEPLKEEGCPGAH